CWTTVYMAKLPEAPRSGTGLDVVVFVVRLEVGCARIHHDKGQLVHCHLAADALSDLRELEHSGYEKDIHVLRREAELLGHSQPSHPNIVGVFAGEEQHAALCHFELAEIGA